jgi:membrane protein implicated in regulation of membrane protease activity
MTGPKLRSLLGLWTLALGISALLAAAGGRWSAPLPIRADLVAFLLLAPPLATLAWLLRHWRLPVAGEGGESVDCAEDRH